MHNVYLLKLAVQLPAHEAVTLQVLPVYQVAAIVADQSTRIINREEGKILSNEMQRYRIMKTFIKCRKYENWDKL